MAVQQYQVLWCVLMPLVYQYLLPGELVGYTETDKIVSQPHPLINCIDYVSYD